MMCLREEWVRVTGTPAIIITYSSAVSRIGSVAFLSAHVMRDLSYSAPRYVACSALAALFRKVVVACPLASSCSSWLYPFQG
jgi:hypothetical protein